MRLQRKLAFLVFIALALPWVLCPQEISAESKLIQPSASDGGSVQFLYTGKLLGYFRIPDAQSPDQNTPCPDDDDKRPSLAAQRFDELMLNHKLERVILVGMGDNFAPEIEARKFCAP